MVRGRKKWTCLPSYCRKTLSSLKNPVNAHPSYMSTHVVGYTSRSVNFRVYVLYFKVGAGKCPWCYTEQFLLKEFQNSQNAVLKSLFDPRAEPLGKFIIKNFPSLYSHLRPSTTDREQTHLSWFIVAAYQLPGVVNYRQQRILRNYFIYHIHLLMLTTIIVANLIRIYFSISQKIKKTFFFSQCFGFVENPISLTFMQPALICIKIYISPRQTRRWRWLSWAAEPNTTPCTVT